MTEQIFGQTGLPEKSNPDSTLEVPGPGKATLHELWRGPGFKVKTEFSAFENRLASRAGGGP